MTKFKTLQEAIDSIDYGMCSICSAEHEFPNVKCDYMSGNIDENGIYYSGGVM
jgi:hypothetical protein